MKSLSDFLGKFRRLEHPDQKKDLLAKFIFIETSLSLNKDQIEVRGRTIFIKADSYIKAEIFFKKDSLLEKIANNFPDLRITDIK